MTDASKGYVGWLGTFQGKKGTGKEKNFESLMVSELRSLGAILYVKTSVPHTLMCGETVNNIIGYTQNSKNRNLSSGGSSGGEGALIGARGSVVGFGTGQYCGSQEVNGVLTRAQTSEVPFASQQRSTDFTEFAHLYVIFDKRCLTQTVRYNSCFDDWVCESG